MKEKPNIFITRKLPKKLLKPYEAFLNIHMWDSESTPIPRKTLLAEVKKSHGLLSMLSDQVNDELFQHAPHVDIVSNLAVGYDNIDLDAAKKHDVVITNTPDVLTETTADLTFALLMATGRRLIEASDYVSAGEWTDWSPFLLAGSDVHNQTIGIVGMGRIGQAVARRARGFNMRVLYHNRTRNMEAESELSATYVEFEQLLTESDYVVTLVPLTDETEQLFNEHTFRLMKNSAIFINASRGQTVDEQALYDALRTDVIAAAGLDVFAEEPISADHPLLQLDNTVCLPHIGSATVQTREKMIQLCLENLKQFFSNNTSITPVIE